MHAPTFLILGAAVAAAVILWWQAEALFHTRRIARVRHRVHVNGIRGKSTVTRLIAGILREAGYTTIGKSTGTFAAVIDREGADVPIVRTGPPTILEQIRVARDHITPDVDAWVVECMAIRPAYQRASEERIVRSTIGVLTNVREDHQDVMGETLPEIARSLLSTCPTDGVLITAEQSPELLAVIREVAAARRTRVVVADPAGVPDGELAAFDYLAFKENVAIGFELARLLGVDRATALRGMVRAGADPGVARLLHLRIGPKVVTWANLFAVNDRESMVAAMQRLAPHVTPETTTVGILNNRADRERRAVQFADVAVRDLSFDRLVTFGAYERIVTERLVDNGYARSRILNLGDDLRPGIREIVDKAVLGMPTEHVLLVGFVNIHTPQAEMLLEYLEGLTHHEPLPTAFRPVPVTAHA